MRKRVGEVFNKRADEFEDLRGWNDYLEEVEGLVFDLMSPDVKVKLEAEERLRGWRERNAREIELNKQLELEENEMERSREKSEREAMVARRMAILRADEEEKADLARSRAAVLERLANSDSTEDAEKILRKAQKIVLKKSSARRNLAESAPPLSSADNNSSSFTIKGLKARKAAEREQPYDPFGGLSFIPTRYVVREEYDHEPLLFAKKDVQHAAGGYSMQEYYERTLFEAFSGLAVFVDDEIVGAVSGRDGTPGSVGVSDVGRRTSGLRLDGDDVF